MGGWVGGYSGKRHLLWKKRKVDAQRARFFATRYLDPEGYALRTSRTIPTTFAAGLKHTCQYTKTRCIPVIGAIRFEANGGG